MTHLPGALSLNPVGILSLFYIASPLCPLKQQCSTPSFEQTPVYKTCPTYPIYPLSTPPYTYKTWPFQRAGLLTLIATGPSEILCCFTFFKILKLKTVNFIFPVLSSYLSALTRLFNTQSSWQPSTIKILCVSLLLNFN